MTGRIAFAALIGMFSSVAMATPAQEVGYPAGSLAVAPIGAGDYATAERILTPVNREDALDPARLINAALLYSRTGRIAEARQAALAAETAPDARLMLADGREASSRDIARSLRRTLDARIAAR